MARVRGVSSAASRVSSRLSVSGRTSAKTGRAPRSTKALTVETKVKAGTMTSSPGWISSSRAAISSACVQDVVSRARATPSSASSRFRHCLVNRPSPEIWPAAMAWAM